jgi:aminotransferase
MPEIREPSVSLARRTASRRTDGLVESVIREMTRLALQHGAINLSQGYPDFAIDADINQYAITWGAKSFRDALAREASKTLGWNVNPETEITVCCGATEAMFASFMGVLNPGDEVIVIEPFYENYGPDCKLTGAVPRYVRLRPPDWTLPEEELAAAFNESSAVRKWK